MELEEMTAIQEEIDELEGVTLAVRHGMVVHLPVLVITRDGFAGASSFRKQRG